MTKVQCGHTQDTRRTRHWTHTLSHTLSVRVSSHTTARGRHTAAKPPVYRCPCAIRSAMAKGQPLVAGLEPKSGPGNRGNDVSCGMSRFYDKRAWRDRTRKQALFDGDYLCQRCGTSLLAKGKGSVHHKKELKRAAALAVEPANLQCLCRSCHTQTHNELKSNRIRSGCDVDGWPTSKDHPWYRTH